MKIIKLIVLLLATQFAMAQVNVSAVVGADIKNGIVGSNPTDNNPELDLLARVDFMSDSGLGGVVFYETFQAIDFQKWGLGFKQDFKVLDRVKVGYILEPTVIKRNWGQIPIYNIQQFYDLVQSNPNYNEYTEFTQQELLEAGVDIVGYEANKVKYLAFGVSVPISYMITNKLGVEVQYNALYRTDLEDRYGKAQIVNSFYLNLSYKIN